MKDTKSNYRPRRDFAGLEQRRFRAARMFAAGVRQAEVARRLGVSRQSVSCWFRQFQQHGRAGLRAAGRAGRKPKLTPSQLRQVDAALLYRWDGRRSRLFFQTRPDSYNATGLLAFLHHAKLFFGPSGFCVGPYHRLCLTSFRSSNLLLRRQDILHGWNTFSYDFAAKDIGILTDHEWLWRLRRYDTDVAVKRKLYV